MAKARAVVLAAVLVSMSGGVFGMSESAAKGSACWVVDGEKLPSGLGGPEALCSSIEGAVQEKAPDTPYSIKIRVLSAHSLAAAISLGDGRVLPEQRMDVSDRQLNRGSVNRFAAAIASEIAKAGGR